MAAVELPVPAEGVANVTYQVKLDGVSYGLEYRWSARDSRWTLSLFDSEGTTLFYLRAVAVGEDLLDGDPKGTFPPGVLMPVVNEPYRDGYGYDIDDPAFDDLASGVVRMVYLPEADVEAALDG